MRHVIFPVLCGYSLKVVLSHVLMRSLVIGVWSLLEPIMISWEALHVVAKLLFQFHEALSRLMMVVLSFEFRVTLHISKCQFRFFWCDLKRMVFAKPSICFSTWILRRYGYLVDWIVRFTIRWVHRELWKCPSKWYVNVHVYVYIYVNVYVFVY